MPGTPGQSVPKMKRSARRARSKRAKYSGSFFGGRPEISIQTLGRPSARTAATSYAQPAPAVGENERELAEVVDDVVQLPRVHVAVRGSRVHARPEVDDDRNAALLADRVRLVERPRIDRKAAVHGVDLESHCAEGQLALELVGHGMMQMWVEVGDQAHAAGVVLHERQDVLDGLDAGHLRAVLGEHEGDVDALLLEVSMEAIRHDQALLVERPRRLARRKAAGPDLPTGP